VFYQVAELQRTKGSEPKKLRKQIESQLQAEKRRGVGLQNVTPEMIVGSGGMAVGALIVQSVPILGMMGAPAIAGIILIIYNIGLDAFCRWTDSGELTHPHNER